jgi:hypothetical protein
MDFIFGPSWRVQNLRASLSHALMTGSSCGTAHVQCSAFPARHESFPNGTATLQRSAALPHSCERVGVYCTCLAEESALVETIT